MTSQQAQHMGVARFCTLRSINHFVASQNEGQHLDCSVAGYTLGSGSPFFAMLMSGMEDEFDIQNPRLAFQGRAIWHIGSSLDVFDSCLVDLILQCQMTCPWALTTARGMGSCNNGPRSSWAHHIINNRLSVRRH